MAPGTTSDDRSPPAPGRLRRWLRRVLLGAAMLLVLASAALTIAWHASPFPLEKLAAWPAGALVTDRAGEPLLVRAARDGQLRLPIPLVEAH